MSGACRDIRELIQRLEAAGRLHRVACPVDKDTELACIARWAMESASEHELYGMLFENITGHSVPVAVQLYATHAMYASALGVESDNLLTHWNAALENPRPPAPVQNGPVHQVVETEPDLNRIPIPTWTPGRDSGPYIPSAAVITKDAESGVQNLATYRIQVQGPRHLGVFFGSRLQHGAMHHAQWTKKGQPTPIALVIGAEPAVSFAAAAKTAYGIDELTIAGGLAGSPVEVVRCQTVDLLVPARAEYVIEGVIRPGQTAMEGPFGEALGYMNDAAPAPQMEVTCICHRSDPIFHGIVQQVPPSEGHVVMEMGVLGPLWHYITRKLGLAGIRDLAIAPGAAGVATLVVQVEKGSVEKADSIGRILAKLNFGQKMIVLVDEDVDIRDPQTLAWALSARVDPSRDISLIDATKTFQLDPAVMHRAEKDGLNLSEPPYTCSLAVVNATVRCDAPALSLPKADPMQKVLERWRETGLPAIRPRPRLERMLKSQHPQA